MNYYVYHSTNIDNLMNILKSKILYANKYLDKNKRRLSGFEESQYIYASIFTNKTTVNSNFGVALLFSPEILYKEPFIFNDGWLAYPTNNSIYVDINDKKKLKDNKIKKMLDIVDNSKSIVDHEILFIGRVIIDKYLVGILCPNCDKNTILNIRNMINKNIKVFTSDTLPKTEFINLL